MSIRLLKMVSDGLSSKNVDAQCGVTKFISWQWFCCCALCILSFALMAYDPWFGGRVFRPEFAFTALLVSSIIWSTLFFDLEAFGKPSGANLTLQFFWYGPLLLFVSRILSRPTDDFERNRSVLERMLVVADKGKDYLIGDGFPPRVVQEILSSPSLAFMLFFLFLGTALPSRESRGVKGGWLILVAIVSLWSAISQTNSPSFLWYVGAVSMFVALYLMKHDVRQHHSDWVLVKTMKSVKDAREYEASIRICKASLENRGLQLPAALDIVQEVYNDYDGQEIGYIAETICTRLIERHGLLALIHEDMKQLVPTAKFKSSMSGFQKALLFPRDIIVFLLCLLWVVSPLDAIPDFIPVIGVLDDVAMAYLGAWGLRGVFSDAVNRKKRFADHI